MPYLPGPAEKHDLPLRARHVPDVRRPDHSVPYLPQASRETHSPLLIQTITEDDMVNVSNSDGKENAAPIFS